jgi:glycosyltransferase involved in cell wall biosynthesis
VNEVTDPLVSVCIPSFNAEATIGATLRSVIGQSYSRIRIVVVDNNSTDATAEVVRQFRDPRIELHCNSVNLGGEGNFNRCIELATGKYTAIYHADDIYEPDIVAEEVRFLEAHSNASAVFTEAWIINDNCERTGFITQPSSLSAEGVLYDFQAVLKAVLRHSNFLICPSVMAPTEVYQRHVKRWRGEIFGSSADLDVWLRMLQFGPVGILPRKLMQYRVSSHQGSAKVRLETRRAAFFSVVDHYLAIPEVRKLLSDHDLMNYERLESRDCVMRAANAMIVGDSISAAKLCPDIMTANALRAAVATRRGLAVWVLGAFIRASLALELQPVASSVLLLAKKFSQK